MIGSIPEPGEVSLVEGHALDLIEGIHETDLDLVATDPPYAFGGEGDEHAVSAAVATVLREAAHRMARGAWMVVFCASSWRSTAYMIEATRGILEPVRMGHWLKPEARTRVKTVGWSWASVTVLVLRRPGTRTKTAKGRPVELLDYIVEAPLKGGRRAALPGRVCDWALAPFADPGGLMLDPFAGSGALCKAAAAAGMAGLGFERRLDGPTDP